jgi:hypothetical protein
MHRKGHRKYRTEIRNYSLMGWMYIRKRVLKNVPAVSSDSIKKRNGISFHDRMVTYQMPL